MFTPFSHNGIQMLLYVYKIDKCQKCTLNIIRSFPLIMHFIYLLIQRFIHRFLCVATPLCPCSASLFKYIYIMVDYGWPTCWPKYHLKGER